MKVSILKDKKKQELLYTTLSVMALLTLWKIASMVVEQEILIPSPEATLMEIIRIIQSPNFIMAVVNTLRRALIGFGIALGAGIGLGLLGGFSKVIYYLLTNCNH
ncbi:hypothetical protein [Alkaliphilus transvaalensis]|uniref:hypothetical protein n=1 Tax=Alkaliphilus transvaalensis TaxID=114628 RepID=UPI0005585161|nr:hypothetical protein [Alkaliphilus transvaalensis]